MRLTHLLVFSTKRGRYPVNEDSANLYDTPGSIQDSLTELLRQGARGLIEKAVEAELPDQHANVTGIV